MKVLDDVTSLLILIFLSLFFYHTNIIFFFDLINSIYIISIKDYNQSSNITKFMKKILQIRASSNKL